MARFYPLAFLREFLRNEARKIENQYLISARYVIWALQDRLSPDSSREWSRRGQRWDVLSRNLRVIFNKCDICGAPTVSIHHKLKWETHPNLRFDIQNLQPLCDECHRKQHPEISDEDWDYMRGN